MQKRALSLIIAATVAAAGLIKPGIAANATPAGAVDLGQIQNVVVIYA